MVEILFFKEFLSSICHIDRNTKSCFLNCLLELYSVGGRDGSSCLSSMEYYDPHTNKWNMCAPMCSGEEV